MLKAGDYTLAYGSLFNNIVRDMNYSILKGQIQGARQMACPNFNLRPEQAEVSLLVIHNICLPPEQFGGPYIAQFFNNELDPDAHPYFASISQLQVSSHLLIDRQGQLMQFVNLEKRAWHAGRSDFAGQPECNDYSIGVELEGSDNQAYEAAQYQCLARLTKALQQAYPAISGDRITGHSDIAPGRKTDPGPFFDWDYYRELLA